MSHWYQRALVVCNPFIFPETRRRVPWEDDRFFKAVEGARLWLTDNPCPDPSIGCHLAAMLNSFADMKGASVVRVMELHEIVDLDGQFVDRRRTPRMVLKNKRA